MRSLSDVGTINDIISRYGFDFSKGMGQNFIVDPSVCPRMAELSGIDERCGVLEIGPGIGVLTVELAKRARRVAAIELDSRLLPVLAESLRDYPNVEVIQGDVLKLDLREVISNSFSDCDSVAVCANLPYYITSPVIIKLLESDLPVSAVTVMVQKEAADRICAPVGSRESSALTVAVNYYSQPELLFEVGRDSFMPPPKVDSAVIRMTIRPKPPVDVGSKAVFFAMVKAGFSRRRKVLTNSLTSYGMVNREQAAEALARSQIPANFRIEQLDMSALGRLSKNICDICQNPVQNEKNNV